MTLYSDDGSFAYARQPWIPKLVDILYKAQTEAEGAYYSRFGLQACVWDPALTYLAGAKDAVVQYFNERYLHRRISQETLERWQVRLQTKLDEIAPRYDRAIRLYAQNNTLMDKVMASQTTTYNNVKDEKGGQDTVTATDSDTVDTAINASHQYADSVRTTVDSGNRSNTRSGSVTVEAEPEGGILENINLNTDDWRNLTVQFAAEFENLFLNVLW